MSSPATLKYAHFEFDGGLEAEYSIKLQTRIKWELELIGAGTRGRLAMMK